jgi:hypothetical protein
MILEGPNQLSAVYKLTDFTPALFGIFYQVRKLLHSYDVRCVWYENQCRVDITHIFIYCAQIRLKKEQEEKVRKRKEKAEAHLYTIIKVMTTCFSIAPPCLSIARPFGRFCFLILLFLPIILGCSGC